MYEPLLRAIKRSLPLERQAIFEGLLIAWDRYFALGEKDDFALRLGNLLTAMGRYRDALKFFEVSLAGYGERERTQTGIALCRQHIGAEPVTE